MVIEFAIFINMGIPHYTGTVLPFIASIVIGTIQLGATVDYAILMTNKYKRARNHGAEKRDAVRQFLTVCHRQCIKFLRSNIWCRNVFQYRYDQFLMYASCKRCIDQFGCRSIYPAGNVYGI